MSVGKKRRLKRIFREDNKSVIVPMDHGVSLGPIRGLINMQEIIDKLVLGGADGIVLHKGIAKKVETHGMGLISHLSASTNLSSDHLWKIQVCSVAHAVRLGADLMNALGSPIAIGKNFRVVFVFSKDDSM